MCRFRPRRRRPARCRTRRPGRSGGAPPPGARRPALAAGWLCSTGKAVVSVHGRPPMHCRAARCGGRGSRRFKSLRAFASRQPVVCSWQQLTPCKWHPNQWLQVCSHSRGKAVEHGRGQQGACCKHGWERPRGVGSSVGLAVPSVSCTQGEVNVHTIRVTPSGTRSRPPVLMSSCRPIVHASQVHLGSGKQRFTWLQLFGGARRSQLGIGACCLAVLQLDRQVSGAVLLGAQGAVCAFREHQSLQ